MMIGGGIESYIVAAVATVILGIVVISVMNAARSLEHIEELLKEIRDRLAPP